MYSYTYILLIARISLCKIIKITKNKNKNIIIAIKKKKFLKYFFLFLRVINKIYVFIK